MGRRGLTGKTTISALPSWTARRTPALATARLAALSLPRPASCTRASLNGRAVMVAMVRWDEGKGGRDEWEG